MASVSVIKHPKQVGRSKAQMSLQKIIDFISSSSQSSSVRRCNQSSLNHENDLEIDLNLRLGPKIESEIQSACSGVGEPDGAVTVSSPTIVEKVLTVDKSSEGECDPKEIVDEFPAKDTDEQQEDDTRELSASAVTNLEIQSSEIETEQTEAKKIEIEKQHEVVKKCRRSVGYLDLLVEAAIVVSGDFDEQEEEDKPAEEEEEQKRESKKKGKRRCRDEETETKPNESNREELKKNERWMLEFCEDIEEDTSPVVRSKRGRNQVLPSKYRDTVLEPWKPLTRQRSSKQRSNK